MLFKAAMRRPMGFSDRPHSESEVDVYGFVFGPHQDAKGYGRGENVAQAIVYDGQRLDAVPVAWLTPIDGAHA